MPNPASAGRTIATPGKRLMETNHRVRLRRQTALRVFRVIPQFSFLRRIRLPGPAPDPRLFTTPGAGVKANRFDATARPAPHGDAPTDYASQSTKGLKDCIT
jgi:hypothetical protein